jgi:capsular exopolysaccharide synthesis family protein
MLNGPWDYQYWEWCRLSDATPEYSSIPLLSGQALSPVLSFKEAYTLIRTHLRLMSVDKRLKTILVTSPTVRDGKTTTAANLAISMAQGGTAVWLINCDLRRPAALDSAFAHPNGAGLTTVLAGLSSVEEALLPTGIEGLHYLPAGPSVPSPPDLLGSLRLEQFLVEAKSKISWAVLDSPPVALSESLALSTKVDGVLLVVRLGETPRARAQDAVRQLRSVGANLLGIVLNAVPLTRSRSSSGYYSEDYFHGRE